MGLSGQPMREFDRFSRLRLTGIASMDTCAEVDLNGGHCTFHYLGAAYQSGQKHWVERDPEGNVMARIVLGLGTSHSPMLLVDAADLPRYEENDRRLTLLDMDGSPTSFDTLLAGAADRLAGGVTPAHLSARHAAAQAAIAGLADALASAALDALIVIGDDQKEMLRDDHPPALVVYDRPTIRWHRPPHAPGRPEWATRGSDRYYPDEPVDYPVAQALAQHLRAHVDGQGFAASAFAGDDQPMGHAFAFVCSQLMRGAPIPIIPVLLNALYPPDQPGPLRCLEIGEAIERAVEAFPRDARVGVVASGGLSHFVVDEGLDRAVVQGLSERDHATLVGLKLEKLQSGNAEIRNWICAAGALRSLRVERIDYFPGYRTRAGTGVGLCFAIWW
jgi:3-O-methylgallate 3,4-dioxygenase